MKRKAEAVPTKGEFEILQVLWKRSSATVKEVHEEIGRDGAYTTTLKLLQIMTAKGLVERKEVGRAHVYTALLSEKQGTGEFIGELVERVFGGSPLKLVMQVLGSGKPTRSELKQIRHLIEKMEGEKK